MVLVTNAPQPSGFIGPSIGGDWKTMLFEAALGIAETVITNYVRDVTKNAIQEKKQTDNVGKKFGQAQHKYSKYNRPRYRNQYYKSGGFRKQNRKPYFGRKYSKFTRTYRYR